MELDTSAPCMYARYYDGWCPYEDECADLHFYSDGQPVKPFTDEEKVLARQEYPELEDYWVGQGAPTWTFVASTSYGQNASDADWAQQDHSRAIRNADAG